MSYTRKNYTRKDKYKQLDGFNNVVITCSKRYLNETVSFRWVIECNDFVYKSRLQNNWSHQVWQRAKKMYNEQVKHVIQP